MQDWWLAYEESNGYPKGYPNCELFIISHQHASFSWLRTCTEWHPCCFVKYLWNTSIVLWAALWNVKQISVSIICLRVNAWERRDTPRYRDARIRRATAKPSSYWTVRRPYRARRSRTVRSSRRSHFNASGLIISSGKPLLSSDTDQRGQAGHYSYQLQPIIYYIGTYFDPWTIFKYLVYPLEHRICEGSKWIKDREL